MPVITNQSNAIQKALDNSFVTIENLMNDSKRNFNDLLDSVLKIQGLISHDHKKIDKQYTLEAVKYLKVQSEKLKNTYNPWGSATITVLSNLISIAGGLAGFGALSGNTATAKQWEVTSKGLSTIGQGSSAFSSLFENSAQGRRTAEQMNTEEAQRMLSAATSSSNDKGQQFQGILQKMGQTEQARHNMAQSVTNNGR